MVIAALLTRWHRKQQHYHISGQTRLMDVDVTRDGTVVSVPRRKSICIATLYREIYPCASRKIFQIVNAELRSHIGGQCFSPRIAVHDYTVRVRFPGSTFPRTVQLFAVFWEKDYSAPILKLTLTIFFSLNHIVGLLRVEMQVEKIRKSSAHTSSKEAISISKCYTNLATTTLLHTACMSYFSSKSCNLFPFQKWRRLISGFSMTVDTICEMF